MHLQFLLLPLEERRLYFEQVAQRRSLSPVIVEKDFWVCWLLALLFNSRNGDVLVFKGGTSLSKVFGVIARFSEDIDLSVSPDSLGLSDIERLPQVSRNRADQWMKEAEAKCAMVVQQEIQPELERAVTAVLGPSETAWFEFLIDLATNSPVLLFHYPTTQPPGLKYLNRAVKLEFGSLTDQRPVGRHAIRPWLVEDIPHAFADWQCEVVALELERSFWKKATILHAERHRPPDRPTPDRFSRHYADTVALALHPIAGQAIKTSICETELSNGKAAFSGAGGLVMTWPGLARLGWSRHRRVCLHFVSTTMPCETCT